MTRQDILAKVQRQELSMEDALILLEKLDRMHPPTNNTKPRKPPQFKVAEKSGWCSVYFDGLWQPCTLPSRIWLELLEDENVKRFKQFLEENKDQFRNKE